MFPLLPSAPAHLPRANLESVSICVFWCSVQHECSFPIESDFEGSVLHDGEQWDFCSSFGSDSISWELVCTLDCYMCWRGS